MAKPHICAIFLFNHRYEKNIAKLEAIYAERFQHRRYIMPFASSDTETMLRVYETSWNFSGHIAQAAKGFIDPKVTHYVFIADDLILNPTLNESNILDALGVGPEAAYIKSLASSDALRYRWRRSSDATMALKKGRRGFDYATELPFPAEAQTRFERMGLRFPGSLVRTPKEFVHRLSKLFHRRLRSVTAGLRVIGQKSKYPLLAGYSDFLVVPASAIDKFVRYCGVFAAMNIFAELAVPTALALACDEVVTEYAPGAHFVGYDAVTRPEQSLKGVEFWDREKTLAFAQAMDFKLARLKTDFPPDWLYVHPVKLSQFN